MKFKPPLTGIFSGLIGALCCVTPLVLFFLGMSTVGSAITLSAYLQNNYRWTLFLPVAAIMLVISIYLHVKRTEGVCSINTLKNQWRFTVAIIITAIITWILLLYLIVPAIFSIIQKAN